MSSDTSTTAAHPRATDSAQPEQAVTQLATTHGSTARGTVAHAPANDDQAHQLHLGFERVRHEVEAVSKFDLEPLNLAIEGVVQTVLGVFPRVIELRSELATLGPFDVRSLDNLRDHALALGHTQMLHRGAKRTRDTSLVKRLVATRERFHAEAHVLVLRGMLDGVRVRSLRSGNGHRGIAYDVIGLCELFLAAWNDFGGRSLLERAEIEQARLDANLLLQALAARQQRPNANADIAQLRQQAYTLLVRNYNEVRAAVTFIRHKHGDADDIMPSLYARRRKPKRSVAAEPEEHATRGEREGTSAGEAEPRSDVQVLERAGTLTPRFDVRAFEDTETLPQPPAARAPNAPG